MGKTRGTDPNRRPKNEKQKGQRRRRRGRRGGFARRQPSSRLARFVSFLFCGLPHLSAPLFSCNFSASKPRDSKLERPRTEGTAPPLSRKPVSVFCRIRARQLSEQASYETTDGLRQERSNTSTLRCTHALIDRSIDRSSQPPIDRSIDRFVHARRGKSRPTDRIDRSAKAPYVAPRLGADRRPLSTCFKRFRLEISSRRQSVFSRR